VELGATTTTRIVLWGGRAVLIGPLDPSDRRRFLTGLGRASPDSMYKRFMTPLARLSICSKVSLVSIGSVGSVLSIGSVASAASAFSVGSASDQARAMTATARSLACGSVVDY
jgi:hypothetical protein